MCHRWVLLLSLIWLSYAYSMDMAMDSNKPTDTMTSMGDAMAAKPKRHFNPNPHSPCPPFYPNFGTYLPPPTFSKPYGPPTYPKTIVGVSASQVQYIHRPAMTAKQMVSYVKPTPSYQTIQKPTIQLHPIHPIVKQEVYPMMKPKVTFQNPLIAYAPLYNKPMPHPMTYPIDTAILKPLPLSEMHYFKKYEVPVQQIPVYQKPTILVNPAPTCEKPAAPQHVPYTPPKVIHVPPPISYVKFAEPMVHHHHHAVQVPVVAAAHGHSCA